MTLFISLVMASNIIYTNTILAPVGRFMKKLSNIPNIKHTTDIIPDIMISSLKLPVSPFAIIAGKTIKLDIKSVPIILIPRTTINAVRNEIKN